MLQTTSGLKFAYGLQNSQSYPTLNILYKNEKGRKTELKTANVAFWSTESQRKIRINLNN